MDCDGDIKAFKLTPQKPELLWTTKPGNHRAGSPLIYQEHVYVAGDHGLRCLDLKTGALKAELKKCGTNYSSPVLADGKLFYPTGHAWYPVFLLMASAGPEKIEQLGLFPHDPKLPDDLQKGAVCTCSSPAVADGRMYLRMVNYVACYDLTEAGNK